MSLTPQASAFDCGEPSPTSNEQLNADVEGKAQLLTRWLADTKLVGGIQTARSEIFSKYPEAEQSRWNAMFQYQLCQLLNLSSTLSDEQKLDKLIDVQREFALPIKPVGGSVTQRITGSSNTQIVGSGNNVSQ